MMGAQLMPATNADPANGYENEEEDDSSENSDKKEEKKNNNPSPLSQPILHWQQ